MSEHVRFDWVPIEEIRKVSDTHCPGSHWILYSPSPVQNGHAQCSACGAVPSLGVQGTSDFTAETIERLRGELAEARKILAVSVRADMLSEANTKLAAALEAKEIAENNQAQTPCCGEFQTCLRACTPRGENVQADTVVQQWATIGKQEADLAALKARLEEAEKDAKRYRWLCERVAFGDWSIGRHEIKDKWGGTDDYFIDDKAHADEVIDAALGGSDQGGEG